MLALTRKQHNLCAYCEIELKDTDRQIEHFHPKSDMKNGVEWAFLPSNLLAACKGGDNPNEKDPRRTLEPIKENRSCGASHGNQVLQNDQHPANLPAMPSIFLVYRHGEITVNHEAYSKNAEFQKIAQSTIVSLNLNCRRLKNARSGLFERLLKEFNQRTQEQTDAEAMSEMAIASLLPDDSGKLPPFFTTRRSFLVEFAEELLQHHPEVWI